MGFEMGIGIGYCIGIVFGINLVRMLYPDENESVWGKRSREKKMINDAIEKERKRHEEYHNAE